MCTDCGCSERPDHEHLDHEHLDHEHLDHEHPDHRHSHDDDVPPHDHEHEPADRTLSIRRRILRHNDDLAAELRERFARHGVFVVNVVSSPGSGKTELLKRTMVELQPEVRVAALTGDLATENDATRLAAAGVPVRQILTGTMCHLEADMVADALGGWDLDEIDLLFIENVGNMVCPSGFDLGEDLRVMLVATTEGEDKPLKYPTLTMSADVAIISKIDLAVPVECDVELLRTNLDEIRPGIDVLATSARTGAGLAPWLDLLRTAVDSKAATPVG